MIRRIQLVDVPDVYAQVLGKALALRYSDVASATVTTWEKSETTDDELLLLVAQNADTLRERRAWTVALREQWLCWHPVVLLAQPLPSRRERDDDTDLWAITYAPLVPNLPDLFALIDAAQPVTNDRRAEIAHRTLIGLSYDLQKLRRLAARAGETDDAPPREAMNAVLAEWACNNRAQAIPEIETMRLAIAGTLKAMATTPLHLALTPNDLAKLRSLVGAAENVVATQNLAGGLRNALHTLVNKLRHEEFAVRGAPELARQLARVLNSRNRLLDAIALRNQPWLGPMLQEVCDKLEPALARLGAHAEQAQQEAVKAQLMALVPVLEELIGEITAIVLYAQRGRILPGMQGSIECVLVVEDDPQWHRNIKRLLDQIAPPGTTYKTNVQEATQWLADNSERSVLVLTDIGLPIEPDSEIDPEGGLKLIERSTGHAYRRRFVVLTAHGDYDVVVRAALRHGVEPAAYVEKGSQTWEDEITARIEIARQPPQPLPVQLEVWCFTPSVVRLNGVAAVLTLSPYTVLEYLALNKNHFCLVSEIIEGIKLDSRGLVDARQWTSDNLENHIYHAKEQLRQALVLNGTNIDELDWDKLFEYDTIRKAYRLNAEVRIVNSYDELQQSLPPRRVLVVEDDHYWRADIVQELQARGFAVSAFETTEDARREIAQDPPELLTLDLMLPLQTGSPPHEDNAVDLMRWIARRYPLIRVAVFSSVAWKTSLMLQLIREGVYAADYLVKCQENLMRLGDSMWNLALQLDGGNELSRLPVFRVSPDAGDVRRFIIENNPVRLSTGRAPLLHALLRTPLLPVSRSCLTEELYPGEDVDQVGGKFNSMVEDCRKAITKETQGAVDGYQLIAGDARFSLRIQAIPERTVLK